jgi:hypothetical protein
LTLRELTDVYTTGYPFLAARGVSPDKSIGVVNTVASLGKALGLRLDSIKDDIRAVYEGRFRNVQTFQAAGFTQEDFKKISSLKGDDLVDFFNQKFAGFQATLRRFSGSFIAQWDRMLDSFYQAGAKLGESVLPSLIDFADTISKKIDEYSKDGTFEKFGRSLSIAMDSMGNLLKMLTNNLPMVVQALTTVLGVKLVGSIAGVASGIGEMLSTMRGKETQAKFNGLGVNIVTTIIGAAMTYLLNQDLSKWQKDANNADNVARIKEHLLAPGVTDPQARYMTLGPLLEQARQGLLNPRQGKVGNPFGQSDIGNFITYDIDTEAMKEWKKTEIESRLTNLPNDPRGRLEARARAEQEVNDLIAKGYGPKTFAVQDSNALMQALSLPKGSATARQMVEDARKRGKERYLYEKIQGNTDIPIMQPTKNGLMVRIGISKTLGHYQAYEILKLQNKLAASAFSGPHTKPVADRKKKGAGGAAGTGGATSYTPITPDTTAEQERLANIRAELQNFQAQYDATDDPVRKLQMLRKMQSLQEQEINAQAALEAKTADKSVAITWKGRVFGTLSPLGKATGREYVYGKKIAEAAGFRVTSTTKGGHLKNSPHYAGRAIDIGFGDIKNDPAAMEARKKALEEVAAQYGWQMFNELSRPGNPNGTAKERELWKNWTAPHMHVNLPSGFTGLQQSGSLRLKNFGTKAGNQLFSISREQEYKLAEARIQAQKIQRQLMEEVREARSRGILSDADYNFAVASFAADKLSDSLSGTPGRMGEVFAARRAALTAKYGGEMSGMSAKYGYGVFGMMLSKDGRNDYRNMLLNRQKDLYGVDRDEAAWKAAQLEEKNALAQRAWELARSKTLQKFTDSQALIGLTGVDRERALLEQGLGKWKSTAESATNSWTLGIAMKMISTIESQIRSLDKNTEALERSKEALERRTAERAEFARASVFGAPVTNPSQRYLAGYESMVNRVSGMDRSQLLGQLNMRDDPRHTDQSLRNLLIARLTGNQFSSGDRIKADLLSGFQSGTDAFITALSTRGADPITAFASQMGGGNVMMESMNRLTGALFNKKQYQVKDPKFGWGLGGIKSRFDKGAFTKDLISGAGGLGAQMLVNAMFKSNSYANEGSSIAGSLFPLLFQGLGAWAGPIGILAGGLIGSLFKKKAVGPDDPSVAEHRKRLEELLSSINNRLRPQEDFFRGINPFGASSRWFGGRASGLSLTMALGVR